MKQVRQRTPLEELMRKYKTVERERCRGCGNGWFFDMPDSYRCTTCGAAFGKLNATKQGAEYGPKNAKVGQSICVHGDPRPMECKLCR